MPVENNWLGMTEEQEVEREDLTNITIDLAGGEEEEEEEVEEMVPEERPQLHSDFTIFLAIFSSLYRRIVSVCVKQRCKICSLGFPGGRRSPQVVVNYESAFLTYGKLREFRLR